MREGSPESLWTLPARHCEFGWRRRSAVPRGDPRRGPWKPFGSPALTGDPSGTLATRAMAVPDSDLPLPASDEQKRRSGDVDWATAVMRAGGRDLLRGTKLEDLAKELKFGFYELPSPTG